MMRRIAVAWTVRRMRVLDGAEEAGGPRGARGCDADGCHYGVSRAAAATSERQLEVVAKVGRREESPRGKQEGIEAEGMVERM